MEFKAFFRIVVILFSVLYLQGCSDEDSVTPEPSLAVTPANIAGTWMLVEWNGVQLNDSVYCYITFNRRERTYVMYQKFDSMYARRITGTYSIDEDRALGAVISGTYDYGMGEWNNTYVVSDLYASGSMVWSAVGNFEDICRYVRCDAVPQYVVDEAN